MKRWEDFDNFVVVDYEFRGGNGNPQIPICYLAKDVKTGVTTSHWIDNDKTPSYPTDEKTLFIAYYASAELHCHKVLNFLNPPYILDLFAEFRCLTNGAKIPSGNSLLGACTYYGISGSDSTYKESMRDLILEKQYYTPIEQQKILEYCGKDVEITTKLFLEMQKDIDLPYALIREDIWQLLQRWNTLVYQST